MILTMIRRQLRESPMCCLIESVGSRLLGWWYVCIGLGFGILGLRNFLLGTGPWPVVLRCVIAAGFVVLGVATLRAPRSH